MNVNMYNVSLKKIDIYEREKKVNDIYHRQLRNLTQMT